MELSLPLIIVGLLMDLIGAILIVYPIIHLPSKLYDIYFAVLKGKGEPDTNQLRQYAFYGVILLTFGFSLQIVGNIIQYYGY